MECGIREFYKDKVVFITGATGFFGKGTIEKLLRSTDVKRIYAMARGKRGQSVQERFQSLEKDPIFEVLLQSKPDALQRVHLIAGDCIEPDLGISQQDRKILVSEVQIVIHGAATVRFTEPLHIALAINTRATRLMLQLAKEMKQLVSYLHVSTAYSNSVILNTEEKFYPEHLTCDSEKVLALSELVSEQVLDGMEPALKGEFQNTYTYTKALAEDVIRQEAGNLPISIFRPSNIIATYKEPVVGYIDNLYGPIGLIFGASAGVVHLTLLDVKKYSSMVPLDYAVNAGLTGLWQTAKEKSNDKPKIYGFGAGKNPLQYEDLLKYSFDCLDKFALSRMMWYPFIHCVTSEALFTFLSFFYHIIPGYIFDLGMKLSGKKLRIVKIYKKIHENIHIISYFMLNTFKFENENTRRLMGLMSPEEKAIFDFDIESLDWRKYWTESFRGMRAYLAKEPDTEESFAKGQKLAKKLRIAHNALTAVLAFVAGYLIWSLLKLLL